MNSPKLNRWVEKVYPYVVTLIICCSLYLMQDRSIVKQMFNGINNETFLTTVITALSIAWGFLLTTFTFLLQSNAKALEYIRQKRRFPELIQYNKIAVYISFLGTVYTLLLLLLYKTINITELDIMKSLWVILVILCTILSYRFLRLFYILSDNTKN